MIRRVLDDPGVWAAAVAIVALWCMAQAFVGEPAAPAELPPAVYVVVEREAGRAPAPGDVAVPGTSPAQFVTGAAVAPSPAGGLPPATERQLARPAADGPAAPVTSAFEHLNEVPRTGNPGVP